jgi:hypothetical protein
MTAAKRVFQYLKATANFRLHFNGNGNGSGNGNYSVVRFTDTDWASDCTDRKFHAGHVSFTCHDGGIISWQSRKQDLIALSTLEAEYIAFSEASRAARWLLQLQRDIHSSPSDASPLLNYCDNQRALTHITTGVIKARMKHIGICSHNSRDVHAGKIVDYSYVHTNENAANIITKMLTKEKHTKFTKAMGLWCKEGYEGGRLFLAFVCLWMPIHRLRWYSFPCSHSHFSRAGFLRRLYGNFMQRTYACYHLF